MNSDKKTGRIIGVLFLLIFIMGVLVFQFLQISLFSEDFLASTYSNSNQIIASTLLGILGGIMSIIISILLFPIFKRTSLFLALIYIAFCILNFVSIAIDNVSVLSLLELSKEYVNNGGSTSDSLAMMGTIFYERHWWSHYTYLLVSCLPVFVLYYTFYITRLVPRIISITGIVASILMFAQQLFSIFGNGISMNMLLPMALIQIVLPIWLIIKGLNSQTENVE